MTIETLRCFVELGQGALQRFRRETPKTLQTSPDSVLGCLACIVTTEMLTFLALAASHNSRLDPPISLVCPLRQSLDTSNR